MCPETILVMLRIVYKLRERLPLERIPFAIQKGVPQFRRLLHQFRFVIRTNMWIVPYCGGDVLDACMHLAPVIQLDVFLNSFPAAFRGINEIRFYPSMARAAGVARTPDQAIHLKPIRCADTGLQKIVHALTEVRQFVEVQPLYLGALVLAHCWPFVRHVTKVENRPVV